MHLWHAHSQHHTKPPVRCRHLQQEVEAAQRQAAAASAAAKTLQAQLAAMDARLESRPAAAAADAHSPVLAALRATVQQLEQQLQAAHKAASGRCGAQGNHSAAVQAASKQLHIPSPRARLQPLGTPARSRQGVESELADPGATSCWRRSCAAARRRMGACSRRTGPWPSWRPRSRRSRAPGQLLRAPAAPGSWPRSWPPCAMTAPSSPAPRVRGALLQPACSQVHALD